jgi:solute carrier family 45 protein 1/2/4
MGRVGSFSLVIFSCISLLSSVTLPWLVRPPDDEKRRASRRLSFSSPSSALSSFLSVTRRFQPDLLAVWTFSHFMFSSSMILAPFARSVKFATTIVAICGV